jgi:hypothetical protein
MIDEATYNELDRYFHSQMNAEEKSAFASRLSTNAELRTEFEWLNTMLGGMKQQGRSIMKSTIAGAIAGISSDEVEKYRPSMNRKSFFKKYWWVITSVVVAIGIAVAIYLYTTQSSNTESDSEHGNTFSQEAVIGADNDAGVDSCAESVLNPAGDSLFKSESEGRIAVRETVDVHYKSGVYYEQDNDTRIISQTRPVAENDTFHRSKWQNLTYGAGVEDDAYRKEKKKSMGVTTGYKPFPPYTYKLDDDLMLNAPYYSCKGFTWEGMGSDTVYMTTKDGITYMLLRGKGVKELVPVTGRGEEVNYNPVRK